MSQLTSVETNSRSQKLSCSQGQHKCEPSAGSRPQALAQGTEQQLLLFGRMKIFTQSPYFLVNHIDHVKHHFNAISMPC